MMFRETGFAFLLAASGAVAAGAQGLSGSSGFTAPGASPLFDGVTSGAASGAASGATVRLSLKEAAERAVRNNLAAIYANDEERLAAAKRLTELAALYPKFAAGVSVEQHQVNLAAFGFSGFPGIQQVIGPYGLVDFRTSFTQTIVDRERKHNIKESEGLERAASLTGANTRELVVFVTTELYFQVLASESRVTAVDAQLTRANALHARALDLKAAGLVPGIDVLRAEVEVRTDEQRLIQAKNAVAKQKLVLAHAIGLPLGQDLFLTDRLPEEAVVTEPLATLLEQAYGRRADVRALDARVTAAEEALKAAHAKNQATVSARGDYGVIGRNPAASHGTYTLGVEVKVPLFDRKLESEAGEKEVLLREREAERDSLRGRIELETRTALLDVQSASEELKTAKKSLSLARQQLDQAQDRFSAGITDNLEVIQAQEAVALGDETVIQSLYGFNVARAMLARATGAAERALQDFSGRSVAK